MPGPTPVAVQGDPGLPDAVDVVVIGGGIIGCSAALELAEAGLTVALCEKGVIAGEQSSRNWGWVRISRRDPREVPLMAESLRLWADLDRRTGRATGYRRCGIMFNCRDQAELAGYERWQDELDGYQTGTLLITAAEVRELAPGARFATAGAMLTPADGRAEPQKATAAIAEAARERGVQLLTGCAVRSIETAAGRVGGVVTERGRIACQAVLLAGGAWSRLFAGNAGIELPQLRVINTVQRTTPVAGPEVTIWTDGVAMRRREDGGYTIASGFENVVEIEPDSFRLMRLFLPALRAEWRALHLRLNAGFLRAARRPRRWRPDEVSPFERERVLDPRPSGAMARKALAALKRDFPAFEGARIAQTWAGCIDVTPDAVPVISPVEALPGLTIATGFSGHGFGIGPGAGRLAADLVTGRSPVVDRTPFRLSRFTDGSPIEVISGF